MPLQRIKTSAKSAARRFLNLFGFDLYKMGEHPGYPDISGRHQSIYEKVRPYTMTSVERVFGLISAAEYVVKSKIPGAFVECGVWKGGSAMAAMLAFTDANDREREIYLYDTFSGMTAPTEHDGDRASSEFQQKALADGTSDWCRAGLADVRKNLAICQYPEANIHCIQGKVEDTIPKVLPRAIAILRLDTDWYESTMHELKHLYPLLSPGGVCIIDDYGAWRGARKAVDEFLADKPLFLHRIDCTGRMFVKS